MIIVTGASGGLANLVLERMPRDARIVAGSRTPGQVAVERPVRSIDFDDPAGLVTGFEGADLVLLVSAGYGEDDVVIARHRAAIEAAEQAGVGHIVYTSLTGAGDHLAFALPHRWTERRLKAGSADWTILRNGIYAEMCIPGALEAASTGCLGGPFADGRLAAVAREDLADVTARILADPAEHAGRTYELVGARAVGGVDIAEAVAAATGTAVTYASGSLAQLRQALEDSPDVPGWQVPIVVSTYSNIAADFLAATGGDLTELLDHPPRPALDVIADSVKASARP